MVREVSEEITLIPALKSVELVVIRYPILGGEDGAVQDISTMLIPFCLAIRLVGVLPKMSTYNNHTKCIYWKSVLK